MLIKFNILSHNDMFDYPYDSSKWVDHEKYTHYKFFYMTEESDGNQGSGNVGFYGSYLKGYSTHHIGPNKQKKARTALLNQFSSIKFCSDSYSRDNDFYNTFYMLDPADEANLQLFIQDGITL